MSSTTGHPPGHVISALVEAEAAGRDLEARCSVARSLLAAIQERHSAQAEDRQDLEARSLELRERVDDSDQRCVTLGEAEAASEQRLQQMRSLLVESGRRIEGLRLRGAIAEELLQQRTIALGGLSERLLERKQQLRELTRRSLEQRLRVGLHAWLRPHRLEESLDRWRQTLVRRAENVERLRGVAVLWRLSAFHQALTAWRKAVQNEMEGHVEAAGRRRKALRELDNAVALRAGAGRPPAIGMVAKAPRHHSLATANARASKPSSSTNRLK